MHYLSETQHDKLKHINRIAPIIKDKHVWLDRFTQRNLELFQPNHPEGVPLINIIDQSKTAMGARLLRRWLAIPIKDIKPIEGRQKCVKEFLEDEALLDQTIKAKHRPLVIITSNNEKDLPDAFLRRCFFHHIAFPDRDVLEKIISVHIPKIKKKLLKDAMDIFFDIRKVPGLKKKPSTSELIDWLKLIVSDDIAQEVIAAKNSNLVPPLYGALLKNEQDVELLQRLAFMTRRESN